MLEQVRTQFPDHRHPSGTRPRARGAKLKGRTQEPGVGGEEGAEGRSGEGEGDTGVGEVEGDDDPDSRQGAETLANQTLPSLVP